LQDENRPHDAPAPQEAMADEQRFDVRQIADPDRPDHFTFELNLDGQPMVPPPNLRSLMDSIIQDLGEIPDDYLVAAGDGGYRPDNEEKKAEDVWMGTYHEEGAHIYHEWDYRRQHYRKRWCALREIDIPPGDEHFVGQTRRKYATLIAQLRKSFEALRGEEKLLKKQKNGDNIDFDAMVEAYADMQHGMELSERVLTKLHKHERNIAVMFMVDMSGSTRGWINDAERESLVLLCEALEILGDRYAIYGFSGNTRQRCELYRIKRFDEPYSDMVRARITGIQPKDYTRMGVTIRHLSKLLNEVDARTKLLVTLSDGKPDDYDGYRGDYGIEDTRKALVEARRDGIHPFCITIDSEARDYLPHMYGPVNWVLIDDVRKLPLKVSDIYRRLTT
jgi:nitric oxide reductase NorD protein